MGDTLDILTTDEAQDYINDTSGTRDLETRLAPLNTLISRRIDTLCGPVVQRTLTDEAYDGGGCTLFLRNTPVVSVSAVKEYAGGILTTLTAEALTTSTGNDYYLDTRLGTIERRSTWATSTFGVQRVLVTYIAGRYTATETVDPLFKAAAGLVLHRLWRREAPAWARTPNFDDNVTGDQFGFFRVVDPVLEEFLAGELLGPAIA
jgi:hypothetical protein